MNPKSLVLIAMVAITFSAGCSKSSDLSLVKSGTMGFDESLTVGQAFDNWSECDSRLWEEFKSSNGKRVVQFTCQVSGATEFMQHARSILKNESQYDHFDIVSVTSTFQWTINQDEESFQLATAESNWKWRDGKTNTIESDTSALESVYKNERTFDVETFNATEGLEEAQTARAYADLMWRLHYEGKQAR